MDDRNHNQTTIRILQANVNKSNHAHIDLIHAAGANTYDIITIQEPYLDWRNMTRASNKWTPILPPAHGNGNTRTRSTILVNTSLSTNHWDAIPINHPDITAIKVTGEFGTLRIFNMYVDQANDTAITALEQYLRSSKENTEEGGMTTDVWLGDFNRHHPMWDEPRNSQLFTRANLARAETLIQELANWGMSLALPPFLPTRKGWGPNANYTRCDQVFITAEALDSIIECKPSSDTWPANTDHVPIITTLDLTPIHSNPPPRFNWRATDWTKLTPALKNELEEIPAPSKIRSKEELQEKVENLIRIFDQVRNEHVPVSKPSPYQKRWWSKELQQERNRSRRLANKAYKAHLRPEDPIHEQYRHARNDYATHIHKAKQTHWLEWIEQTDTDNLFTLHKYISAPASDGGKARIPGLKVKDEQGNMVTVTTNEQKSEALYSCFFKKPPAQPEVPMDYNYPPEAEAFVNITEQQVDRNIRKLSPYKATGPLDHSNSLFTHCREDLVPHLTQIFRASLALNYYPDQWKFYTTIVLRKPGKPDYSLPKAYRPVALLDSMAKILSACVAEDLASLAERHNMFPANHFGGRPGRATNDSLMLSTQWIYEKWRQKQVVTALFLDIQGAYPNVVIPMLIHEMRKRGVPKAYTDWTTTKLTGRKTTLRFDDFISQPFDVINGEDQGCPASTVWYGFYNAGLVDPSSDVNEMKSAFIDDTQMMVSGPSFEANNIKLASMMQRAGGGLEWERTHNSPFELDKFGLLHLTRKKTDDPNRPGKKMRTPRPPLTINGHTIQPSKSHKFLGVILDDELRFNEHANYAYGKGVSYLGQTQRIAKQQRGIKGKVSRILYSSVVIPRVCYAMEIWCNPGVPDPNNPGKMKGSRGRVGKIAALQRRALLQITGALQTTPTVTLNAVADILPAQQLINKHCQRAALRLATIPKTHPLYAAVRRTSRRANRGEKRKHLPSPLDKLFEAFPIDVENTETILPVRQTPKYQPKFKIRIADDKKMSVKEDEDDTAQVKVYTDGSGYKGMIGASAVLYRYHPGGRKTEKYLQYHLGPDTEYTVCDGETVGLTLAAHLLQEERGVGRASGSADNQAAIRSTTSIKPKSGHHLVDMFTKRLQAARKTNTNLNLTIRWIAGHMEVEGNERADELAKEAAEGRCSSDRRMPTELHKGKRLPVSRSAIKQRFRRELQTQANEAQKGEERIVKLQLTDPSAPSSNIAKITGRLPRTQASLLTQLITEHAPLCQYLHRFKKAESPRCPACLQAAESVHHYLMECPAYDTPRRERRRALRGKGRKVSSLLTDDRCTRELFKFIAATQRFKSTHGQLELPEETN